MGSNQDKHDDQPADGDLVPAPGAGGDLEKWAEWAGLWADVVPADPVDAALDILLRASRATTPAALWATWSSDATKLMVDNPLEIQKVEWGTYEGAEGAVPAARITAASLTTGEVEHHFTTARGLTTFLRKAELLSMLPLKMNVGSTKTTAGYTVYFPKPA
jgi:hypothetical protein